MQHEEVELGALASQHLRDNQYGHKDTDDSPQSGGEGREGLRRWGCVFHLMMDPC